MLPDPREREAPCEGLQDGGVMLRDGPLGAGSRIGAVSTPDAPLTQAQSTYVRTNTHAHMRTSSQSACSRVATRPSQEKPGWNLPPPGAIRREGLLTTKAYTLVAGGRAGRGQSCLNLKDDARKLWLCMSQSQSE